MSSAVPATAAEQSASAELKQREGQLFPLVMARLGYYSRWQSPAGKRLSNDKLAEFARGFIAEVDPTFPTSWADRLAQDCAKASRTRRAYVWRFTTGEREVGQEASLAVRQTKADQRRDQVAKLAADDWTAQQIADQLNVSRSTVYEDLRALRGKARPAPSESPKNQIGQNRTKSDKPENPVSDLLQDYSTELSEGNEQSPRIAQLPDSPSAKSEDVPRSPGPGRRVLEAPALGLAQSEEKNPPDPPAPEPSDGRPTEALPVDEPPHELEGAIAPTDRADWSDTWNRAAAMLQAGLSRARVKELKGLDDAAVSEIWSAVGCPESEGRPAFVEVRKYERAYRYGELSYA